MSFTLAAVCLKIAVEDARTKAAADKGMVAAEGGQARFSQILLVSTGSEGLYLHRL